MRSRTRRDFLPGGVKSFIWALLLASAIFVPLMIYNGGYFVFLGDFNVQQIPFYRHAHDMIRSGNFFWDWQTDLGANFIGSYSFYLIFSPFFWLTLPFPSDFVPHLMGPLLILENRLRRPLRLSLYQTFCRGPELGGFRLNPLCLFGLYDLQYFFQSLSRALASSSRYCSFRWKSWWKTTGAASLPQW